MHPPAVVVPYDPQWPQQFEELRGRVDVALAGVEHVTEHIGSTAVPGLHAKPIIDLAVVVADFRRGRRDRCSGSRRVATRRRSGHPGQPHFQPPADAIYHHLSVGVDDSGAHRDHVDLRDFLRAHPGEAARYAETKHRLAHWIETDRGGYAKRKAT